MKPLKMIFNEIKKALPEYIENNVLEYDDDDMFGIDYIWLFRFKIHKEGTKKYRTRFSIGTITILPSPADINHYAHDIVHVYDLSDPSFSIDDIICDIISIFESELYLYYITYHLFIR